MTSEISRAERMEMLAVPAVVTQSSYLTLSPALCVSIRYRNKTKLVKGMSLVMMELGTKARILS